MATGFPLIIPGVIDSSSVACTGSDTRWTQNNSGATAKTLVFSPGIIVPNETNQAIFVTLTGSTPPTQRDYWTGNSSGCKFWPAQYVKGSFTNGTSFAAGATLIEYDGRSSLGATAVYGGLLGPGNWGNGYGILIIGPYSGTLSSTTGYTLQDGSGNVFTMDASAPSSHCGLTGITSLYPHTFNMARVYGSSCQLLVTFVNDGCPKSPNVAHEIHLGVGFDNLATSPNFVDYLWGTRYQSSPTETWTMPCH